MALGGGGSAPTPPPAQPQTPVPQEDDPASLEHKQRAAARAKGREGYSAHLLSDKGYDSSLGTSSGPTATAGKPQMLG